MTMDAQLTALQTIALLQQINERLRVIDTRLDEIEQGLGHVVNVLDELRERRGR